MNNQAGVNLRSSRARRAKASVWLDSHWIRWAIGTLVLMCLSLWLLFIVGMKSSVGHLFLIPAAFGAVILLWYHGELKDLAVRQAVNEQAPLDAILDKEVLGRLTNPITPAQLADIVMKLPGGIFYNNRFGISLTFIKNLSSGESDDVAKVWQRALELARKIGAKEIDASIVTAALIFTIENYNFYLAQLQLDGDDILDGLQWHAHINRVLDEFSTKQKSGGIGRDLSFGWAPLLNRLGTNISDAVSGGLLHRKVEGHEEVLSQMMHVLAQPGRRNAALVGEVGVGKTTLVYALAYMLMQQPKKVDQQLRYRQVIELNAATLIARAKGKGELETLLIRLINEALHAKNIIIFLDEAQLFLQDGTGSVDLSNILLPVLEGGALQIVLSLDDQYWLKLSQVNPGLTQLMNRIVVSPLDQPSTMRVIEDQILLLESRSPVIYMHHSLKSAYSLAERFIRDQAFPGKAVRLLEAAAGFAEQGQFVTEKSVQQAVEKSFDVKVQTASTAEERDTLLNLEGRIHERMINQTRAVQVVSDALRRARAGVSSQNKPIGTFLFLGPTGVGKTELSKALAAIYFGGEDRLIRLDLNEYSQESDVSRLIEIGAANSSSLTAQIAKQPFSVVLLDEIEKAHPNVLNVLLQLLDEGMLRDSQNKPVSFRDAIVIATSNAGADKIRSHIEAGESVEQFEKAFIDELINTNLFKPEFLNRFDETVLFRPLTVDELKQVVDLILKSINHTLAAQKISVNLTDSAKAFLAQAGYDPRLGARPLRRVTQRSIENIVAQQLLSGEATPGTVIELDAPEIELALNQRQN